MTVDQEKPQLTPPSSPVEALPIPERIGLLIDLVEIQAAAQLARKGSFLAAETLLLRQQGFQSSPAALDLAARIAVQQGKIQEAANLWERVIKLDPANVPAQKGLAQIVRKQKSRAKRPLWILTVLLVAGNLGLWGILYEQTLQVKDISVRLGGQLAALQSATPRPVPASAFPAAATLDLTHLENVFTSRQDALAQQVQANQIAIVALATRQALPTRAVVTIPSNPLQGIRLQSDDISVIATSGEIQIQFKEGLFLYNTLYSASAEKTLEDIALQLTPYLDLVQIQVIGFQDDLEQGALDLPFDRASAVVKYFSQTAQIPSEIFSIVASKTHPAPYRNDSWQNRSRNRTVLLIVLPRSQ